MPHADGGFGLTPNVIAQTSAKVAMASRFFGLVGSLPLDEQHLWLPNQSVDDPDTWTAPHLLHLKREYVSLVDNYGCVVPGNFHGARPSRFSLRDAPMDASQMPLQGQ
jgi:hypothetical protein